MLKRLTLSMLLCLIAFTAYAAEKDFEDFKVDMTEGWQSAMEPMRQQGMVLVVLVNEAKQSAVNIMIAPTTGEDIKALAEQTAKNMTAQGADLKISKQEGNKVRFEGKQTGVDCVVLMSADPDSKTMATVVLAGDVKEGEKLAKSIKMKNGKLAVF